MIAPLLFHSCPFSRSFRDGRRACALALIAWAALTVQGSFSPASAQQQGAVPAAAAQDEFAATATALDAAALMTERTRVALWGIEPVDSAAGSLALEARTRLDDLMAGRPVRCKVMGWEGSTPVAQCFTAQDVELSVEMLRGGFAVVDRPAVIGSVFEKSFFDAERQARTVGKGAWIDIKNRQTTYRTEEFLGWALAVLILGPLVGFAVVAAINALGFRRMLALQREQIDGILVRQDQMREREKFVISAMFEAEINANKIKLDAFMIIYEELLRNLRDAGRQQRFRQTGEIVHEQPPLNRAIFDAYKDRLEILGSQLAVDITRIYSTINADPEYITLEPGMPIDKAVQKVEGIIDDARSLIPPMDKVLSGLSVIIRDKGRGLALAGREAEGAAA